MILTIIWTFVFICVLVFVVAVSYGAGRYFESTKTKPLAIAPVKHECVWDNWGEAYKETAERNRIGLAVKYQEFQDRVCLGCGVKEVREIYPARTYY